jgi:hypothetical protein
MINLPNNQLMGSQPLYGPQVQRDGIVQALMNGTAPQTAGSSGGGAGFSQAGAAVGALAKALLSPAPFTGDAYGGTYNYQGSSLLPSWLGGTPGAGYTFTDQGGNVSTLGGSLGDFNY